jgi:nucleotide-binding universal stress UspA family protein
MFSISSLLWPTDGGEPSCKALEAAVVIAAKFNAGLYALQIVPPVPPLIGTRYAPMAIKGYDIPLYQQELLSKTENELSQMVSRKVPQEIKVVCEVKIGVPADVIIEFAQEKDIDLIVMATHGRTGLTRFMIGSVTEKTIRQSTIPLLIIPAALGAHKHQPKS